MEKNLPRNHTIKKIKKILHYFGPKLNLIHNELKLINSSDETVIRVGHALRNEAYHNGILRENIITPFTRAYFQTICTIFPKLWIGPYTYSGSNKEKDFLAKYEIDNELLTEFTLKQICLKILKGRELKEIELSKAISDDLIARIQDILDAINYLSSEPGAMSPYEFLKWFQFKEEGGMEFGQTKNDEEFRLFWEEVQDKLADFKPKITISTLEKWIKKANKIKAEKEKGIILQKFWTIDNQLIKIENMIREEVFRYEEEMP